MIFDMLEYRNYLAKQNIIIVYSGPIWAEGIESLGNTVRKRLEYDDASLSTSQSVFSVFIEQMNNILMYSAEREYVGLSEGKSMEKPSGVFTMGLQGQTYFVQCGNVIKNESVQLLKDRIDYINALDKAGLRKYYKEQMRRENENIESKGAGLGLVEIARRASSPIEYTFVQLDGAFSFYTLCVTINRGGQ